MTPPIGSTTIGPGIRGRGALEQARAWLAALQGVLPWKQHSLASMSSLSLENPLFTMSSVGTENQEEPSQLPQIRRENMECILPLTEHNPMNCPDSSVKTSS
ncbi:unnamed protein product [Rangifer tarandus platyrhynchus]|uniref:Uncharacterized protein n=2 Tax=Rangifer tarandus platyrhynchus TaxID=3082113 RepID=A0AC59ZNF0_RANTA|nr:unnamed protein product [Rangifer tarandus platyrhynchus]